MTTVDKKKYKVIGTSPIRHDGADKVTGRAVYGIDYHMPGMLWGKILRSPHAHAKIKSIDASKALALPGVHAVVTGKDMAVAADIEVEAGETSLNYMHLSDNVMARDKALYKGHAVAAVAADTQHIAEEALALIDVDYEVLTPVLNGREGMKADVPLIHPDQTTKVMAFRFDPGTDTGEKSNVAGRSQLKLGDIDAGFKEADFIVEREFTTSWVHQGYIEAQNATAHWNNDDNITVWNSSQGTFNQRQLMAEILKHPVSQIKMVPLEIGGGFGGKIPVYLEVPAAMLSKKTGHPVKMTMTRTEVFEGTGPASAAQMKAKVGATKDGRITAAYAELVFEAGAFPGSAVGAGAQGMFTAYNIENILIDGYDVVVNKPKSAAYRSPGTPQACFPAEAVIDELAELVGMDPLDFRIKNAAKEGDRRADGVQHPEMGNLECMEALKASDHYKSDLGGPNRGRGVASGYWGNAGMPASCSIAINADGTVSLAEGSPDIGGSRTSIAMMCAEAFGIAAEDVHPSIKDTDSIGYNGLTAGSSTTLRNGWAVFEVTNQAIELIKARAARLWETEPENVDFADGVFFSKAEKELKLTFKEMAGKLMETGGPISVAASVAPRGAGPSFTTHMVDVEVDPETGKVDILRYTAAQDVGTMIHHDYVEGQVQGGTAQGIGWALNEEYFYDDKGQMLNSSYLDYRVPTMLDLPMLDTILVEHPNPDHPFGVRGVAEISVVPPLGALANAIYAAVGVRMRDLPMAPHKIVKALQEKNGKTK
ncbi:MAG: xanthine dehydrogenase family protein molybdopterin-binding subunit [SAR202 cluster bacterium]|nr:xanthine dehydrogenase family protein molybdopterin-binding subunit [SAR202 cluster bacterium]|tara:strand:+ start:1599 stop:3893 length:2295 start_codon:yes stop_codon:yes gene_type:complete